VPTEDQPPVSVELPEDLSPASNPLLAKNLGRWAEAYFTSPPEKREEAVVDLLRQLRGEASEKSETLEASEKSGAAVLRFSPLAGSEATAEIWPREDEDEDEDEDAAEPDDFETPHSADSPELLRESAAEPIAVKEITSNSSEDGSESSSTSESAVPISVHIADGATKSKRAETQPGLDAPSAPQHANRAVQPSHRRDWKTLAVIATIVATLTVVQWLVKRRVPTANRTAPTAIAPKVQSEISWPEARFAPVLAKPVPAVSHGKRVFTFGRGEAGPQPPRLRVADAPLGHGEYPVAPDGVTGKVDLRIIIATDGRVKQVEVLSGKDVLARSAINVVRHWRYAPHYSDGLPAEAETGATIQFLAGDVVIIRFPSELK
jgi:TonB family protein